MHTHIHIQTVSFEQEKKMKKGGKIGWIPVKAEEAGEQEPALSFETIATQKLRDFINLTANSQFPREYGLFSAAMTLGFEARTCTCAETFYLFHKNLFVNITSYTS